MGHPERLFHRKKGSLGMEPSRSRSKSVKSVAVSVQLSVGPRCAGVLVSQAPGGESFPDFCEDSVLVEAQSRSLPVGPSRLLPVFPVATLSARWPPRSTSPYRTRDV